MSRPFTPVAVRLARRLVRDDATGCLVWTGARLQSGGYGGIGPGEIPPGFMSSSRTHRVAWEIANGPIPSGLHVLHRCDNPPCCEVAHLFLGTPADNAADKVAKGRQRPGGSSRGPLTDGQVREIRHLHDEGLSAPVIAARFDRHERTIRDVVRGLTYANTPTDS